MIRNIFLSQSKGDKLEAIIEFSRSRTFRILSSLKKYLLSTSGSQSEFARGLCLTSLFIRLFLS